MCVCLGFCAAVGENWRAEEDISTAGEWVRRFLPFPLSPSLDINKIIIILCTYRIIIIIPFFIYCALCRGVSLCMAVSNVCVCVSSVVWSAHFCHPCSCCLGYAFCDFRKYHNLGAVFLYEGPATHAHAVVRVNRRAVVGHIFKSAIYHYIHFACSVMNGPRTVGNMRARVRFLLTSSIHTSST